MRKLILLKNRIKLVANIRKPLKRNKIRREGKVFKKKNYKLSKNFGTKESEIGVFFFFF